MGLQRSVPSSSFLLPHLVQDDFGGQVVGRAAQRVCAAGADGLGKPKVGQLEVAPLVQQQVLGLRVGRGRGRGEDEGCGRGG